MDVDVLDAIKIFKNKELKECLLEFEYPYFVEGLPYLPNKMLTKYFRYFCFYLKTKSSVTFEDFDDFSGVIQSLILLNPSFICTHKQLVIYMLNFFSIKSNLFGENCRKHERQTVLLKEKINNLI